MSRRTALLGDPYILAQKRSGLSLRDARCELILLMCPNDMPVTDSRVASWANVNGGAEAFKPPDQVEPRFGNATHQPPRRILLI